MEYIHFRCSIIFSPGLILFVCLLFWPQPDTALPHPHRVLCDQLPDLNIIRSDQIRPNQPSSENTRDVFFHWIYIVIYIHVSICSVMYGISHGAAEAFSEKHFICLNLVLLLLQLLDLSEIST